VTKFPIPLRTSDDKLARWLASNPFIRFPLLPDFFFIGPSDGAVHIWPLVPYGAE
jgi:hypothetical protein